MDKSEITPLTITYHWKLSQLLAGNWPSYGGERHLLEKVIFHPKVERRAEANKLKRGNRSYVSGDCRTSRSLAWLEYKQTYPISNS
jgi:hypothetical protein